jgi:hypothetical protein
LWGVASGSALAARAEWCWVRPVESTCSLLIDLFTDQGLPICHEMGVALAAGIVTDTQWLRTARAEGLRRLAAAMSPASLYLEDVLAAIDGPKRRAVRRSAVLAAVCGVRETPVGEWSVLAAETDSHDHGFAVISALGRLGGDVCAVGFPKNGQAMVMVECEGWLVERAGLDLSALTASVARRIGNGETWGTKACGRVVASLPQRALLDQCVAAVANALRTTH